MSSITWTIQPNQETYRTQNGGIRGVYGSQALGTRDGWWTANDVDSDSPQRFGNTPDALTAKTHCETALLELIEERKKLRVPHIVNEI